LFRSAVSPGERSSTSMRISIRVVPGTAFISPAKVAERSSCDSAVRHCSSVADTLSLPPVVRLPSVVGDGTARARAGAGGSGEGGGPTAAAESGRTPWDRGVCVSHLGSITTSLTLRGHRRFRAPAFLSPPDERSGHLI